MTETPQAGIQEDERMHGPKPVENGKTLPLPDTGGEASFLLPALLMTDCPLACKAGSADMSSGVNRGPMKWTGRPLNASKPGNDCIAKIQHIFSISPNSGDDAAKMQLIFYFFGVFEEYVVFLHCIWLNFGC